MHKQTLMSTLKIHPTPPPRSWGNPAEESQEWLNPIPLLWNWGDPTEEDLDRVLEPEETMETREQDHLNQHE